MIQVETSRPLDSALSSSLSSLHLLQALSTIRNDKIAKGKERRIEKLAKRDAKLAKEKAVFEPMQKLEKKRKYREMGKARSQGEKRRRQNG